MATLLKKISNLQLPITNYQLPIPNLLLAFLILAYTLYFSWYTINRHNTLNSYAADLSLIDQPMWNTVRGPGGFMELTWIDRQQPRLAEHFEPILIPLAFLFFIWDDVRILLIAQSFALAIGALPVFWIAKYQLSIINYQLPITNWVALAFAAAYLLFPHLQAANIADFHADPFVVAPLLFAFWYATQHRWPWMWLWTIIAMLAKENLPTLTAMLGLYIIFDFFRAKRSKSNNYQLPITNYQLSIPPAPLLHGLVLILVSTTWFFMATFLIVAPLARQYFGAAGPIYLANRYNGGLADLPSLLADPARWRYLFGLFVAAAFLPLLAPELLILGLPVLVANLFSNFPGQYSGEQHYSAPLAATFILAAIYGTRRLINSISLREVNGRRLKDTALIAITLWLLAWSLGYHTLRGWTPLSIRTETYRHTPATSQLPDMLMHIPPEAIVTASAGIHPHLAHRRVIYLFPTIKDADYLLVDVTDIPGAHPYDAHAKITDMFKTGWTLLEASDGLILAQKSPNHLEDTRKDTNPTSPPPPCLYPNGYSPALPLPCSFYNFTTSASAPTYPTALIFGNGHLQLLGYDVLDDPDDGVTLRLHWRPLTILSENLRLWPLIFDDAGQLLNNPTQVPLIAAVWYPPAQWRPGEIVVTETLPQLLPGTFHVGVAVGLGDDSLRDPSLRAPITGQTEGASAIRPGHWLQLASFTRQGPFLTHYPPLGAFQPFTPVEAQFGLSIQLIGFRLDSQSSPKGSTLNILLQWLAPRPPDTDYTVFIHLLDGKGNLVAQNDAYPTWLTPQPTSQWPLNQAILDRHTITLPPRLPAGAYTLQVGLYNFQTLERLTLPDNSNIFQLTQIHVK
jgi:uncharacterized membrane protein